MTMIERRGASFLKYDENVIKMELTTGEYAAWQGKKQATYLCGMRGQLNVLHTEAKLGRVEVDRENFAEILLDPRHDL